MEPRTDKNQTDKDQTQNLKSKIQDFQKNPAQKSWIGIQDFLAGSKISGVDPRKIFWESCILDLGSGSKISNPEILDLGSIGHSDLRLEANFVFR